MAGFKSKQEAALDKLVKVTEELGLYTQPPETDWRAAYKEAVRQHSLTLDELREALARPAQEPVAWVNGDNNAFTRDQNRVAKWRSHGVKVIPLYAKPQEYTTKFQQKPVIDYCTDPDNCKRCKTHPKHRGDMDHAGIGKYPKDVNLTHTLPADNCVLSNDDYHKSEIIEMGKRLFVAVEHQCKLAGTDAAETVDWLCGEYGGMSKLFLKFFSSGI